MTIPNDSKPLSSSSDSVTPVCIEIYPTGDLWIVTGPKRFKVSCTALRLASPVFSRMLDPTSPFSEGLRLSDGTSQDLILHEDDPDATEAVLNVIHHRGRQVPQIVPSATLFSIGELCDKYDMVATLQGWAHLWMSKIPEEESALWSHTKPVGKTRSCSSTDEAEKAHNLVLRWLALSWAFRHPETFEAITRHLIPNIKYNAKGALVDCNGVPIAIDGIPEKVIDLLADSQTTLYLKLHKTIHTHLKPYTSARAICCHKSHACDRIQLGTLMKVMCTIGLYQDPSLYVEDSPQMTAYEILEAFTCKENLATQLSQQQIVHHGAAFRNPTIQHVNCSPFAKIHEALTSVISEVQGMKLSHADCSF